MRVEKQKFAWSFSWQCEKRQGWPLHLVFRRASVKVKGVEKSHEIVPVSLKNEKYKPTKGQRWSLQIAMKANHAKLCLPVSRPKHFACRWNHLLSYGNNHLRLRHRSHVGMRVTSHIITGSKLHPHCGCILLALTPRNVWHW